ncbi:MAG: DUF3696 domain-containing protein [Pseudomonadota bacterium]
MKLSSILFENYKAFKQQEEIEIRPLTILIGRNSSGKSVIARLPLLLARALSEQAEGPLELEFNGLDFGQSFLDLVHNRFWAGAISLGASFTDDNENKYSFKVKLQYFDEPKLFIISQFEFISAEKEYLFEWQGKDPINDAEKYEFNSNQCKINFKGLFPETIKVLDNNNPAIVEQLEQAQLFLNQAKSDFASAMKNITYLGPFRESVQRTYNFPGISPKDVGFAGGKAPALLGDDSLRRRGKLVDSVGNWFAEHLGGWPLRVSKQGDSFSLVLCNPDEPSIEINIADVGAGISQVLPIVVQRQFEHINEKSAHLEIIEQPELHLHPKAHTELADLYITALQQVNTQFIIETHSENFLLRIRRRIAEGQLEPDKVIIYWVNDEANSNNRIQAINIDQHGAVNSWPQGVFAEDFEEAKAIRISQRRSAQ